MPFGCKLNEKNISDINCPDDCEHEELNQVYWTVFQVVFPILIVLGFISNVVNLIVLTRPRMLNKIYRWLRTLAVVDILLCINTIPVSLAKSGQTPSSYSLAWYYSRFGWSLSIGSQIVSFFIMVWFAYDRYLAVCCHEKYPVSLRDEVFRKRIICTVLFVVILYAPTMIVGQVCKEEGDNKWRPMDGYRNVDNDFYKAYAWFREIFSRVVPAALITYFNIKITLRLKQLRSIRDGFASGVPPSRRDKERKLVVLLFWVTALFYIYNTPVAIYYLVFLNHLTIVHEDEQYRVLIFGAMSNLIQMLGNVSTFTVYFLINPEFQRTLKELCTSKKQTDGVEHSDTGVSTSNDRQNRSSSKTLGHTSYENSNNYISTM